MSRGVIVVLAHKRIGHLRACLEAISVASERDNFLLAVVVDEGTREIREFVSSSRPDVSIRLEPEDGSPARARIMHSLKHGLSWAFDVAGADYAIVIEDDILISKDFFVFIKACFQRYSNRPFFRAVNGFGLSRQSAGVPGNEVEVARLNYGVGWGWAIPRRTYKKILPLLRLNGDYHVWDALIEPYLRTGYVVNPRTSKIQNIGFDMTATHTNQSADTSFGQELEASFLSGSPVEGDKMALRESSLGFRWRQDAIALDSLPIVLRLLTLGAGFLLWSTHRLKLALQEGGNRSHLLDSISRQIRKRALPALGRISGASEPALNNTNMIR